MSVYNAERVEKLSSRMTLLADLSAALAGAVFGAITTLVLLTLAANEVMR